MSPKRESDEPRTADEPDNRGHHEAAGASEHKPEQGTKDLAAVQGVDRQHVENEQAKIDVPDAAQQHVQVGRCYPPCGRSAEPADHGQDRQQRHIYQWPCGDTPECSARPRWRIDIRHPAERPQHDLVRSSANLAAGQCMAELMQKDDQKEREILQYVPADGGITSG